MEWDQDAADIFAGLLIADSTREGAKIHAETLARRAGRDRVTREDMERTKKAYYGRAPEEVRVREFEKRAGTGAAEERRRMDVVARDILKRNVELYNIVGCRAEPADRNFEPSELRPDLERVLKGLDVTKIITDKLSLKRPISNHHKFIVTMAACANGCSAPETRSFGIVGVVKPIITDAECSECYLCVDNCRQRAIILRKGRPEIDFSACDGCSRCIKVCPKKVFAAEPVGYRVFVGGRLGRFHQPGFVLFKNTDKATMLKALEATVKFYRDVAEGEESVAELINRYGPAPIYQRIYQS